MQAVLMVVGFRSDHAFSSEIAAPNVDGLNQCKRMAPLAGRWIKNDVVHYDVKHPIIPYSASAIHGWTFLAVLTFDFAIEIYYYAIFVATKEYFHCYLY